MSKFVLTAQLNLQAPRNTNQVLNKIRNDFKGISVPVELQGGKEASRTAKDLTKNLKDATNQSNRLAKSFVASTRRFLAFAAAGRALSLVTNNLSNAVGEAIEFERELIKISQVTGKTVKELGSLTREVKNLSTSLGVNSNQLLSVGRILSQAGFKARELEIALSALAKTELAPTFENIEQTAEGVVAIFNQFRKGAEALEAQLGAINAVAGKFAVESGDLISAVRRVGGVFESAGGSLEELLGLFTSVRATTRESAESIATGLRTILTRIQRPKTIEFLKQFGVELEGLDGKFVGPFEAVKRLSAALDDLPKGSLEFVRIAEELGGFRQIGKVIPLLQQFNVAERARQAAIAGSKSLDKDAATAQQALAVQIQKTREQFSALVRDVVQSNTFKVLAAGALSFANALIQIGNAIKPILPLITVLGGIKLGGFAVNLGKATIGSLKSFAAQGKNQGGAIEPLGFNSGGLVPGSGSRDTVPAMLTPGEFVIRKKSVQKLGLGKLAAANNYAFGGTVEIIDNIGQVNPTGEPTTATSEERILTADQLLRKDGVSTNIKGQLEELNPTDTISVPPKTTQVATLNQDFPEDKVLGKGIAALDQAIKDAIPRGFKGKATSIGKDPLALKTIGGYAFERFSGALLGTEPGGKDEPFDLVGGSTKLTNIAAQPPFAKYLDAKRTRIEPGKIVNKALNDSAVRKRFTSAEDLFFGGLVQAFNAGGLVNEKDIGAAILEAGGSESSSVSVTQGDINKKLGFSGLAKGASPADRYFTSKTFGVQKQGLNKDTSDNFSNALKAGFAAGTDNAVAAVAGDLGLPASTIPASDVENFYSGVRTSLIGDLFEATLRSLKGGGRFSDAEDPARPFDFVGGLGAVSDNFPSVSSLNYVDAKSTFDAASDKELKKKATNQISFELQAAGIKDQPVGTKKALANRGETVPDLPGFPKRKGFATGGPAGSDTVPAMLTPGEFVINKKSAQHIGYANLNKMNKRGVMGFAKGGAVPGVQYLSDGASVGNQLTEFTSAQIVGAIDFLASFLKEAIDTAAFSLGESFEVITDYFKSDGGDGANADVVTELKTVASSVVASSQNLEGRIDDTGQTLAVSIATDIGQLQSSLISTISTAADGIASDNDTALIAGFSRIEAALGAKDANSELSFNSPEILSAIQQVASDVGNRLGPVIAQTNNTLERVITEIQNGNSLVADSSAVIKESLASLGATFTESQQVDAASGEPSDPSVFEIAAGSLVGLAADTIDALSSANADKIGAILGAGADATGGGGPASDVAFDGTTQSLADLQGDLQARIEELTQKSSDAAANGFPLLQAKIEEGIKSLTELQFDNALQASSQGNLEREGKNLDLLQEIDTAALEDSYAQLEDLGGYISDLNAAIIEAIQTNGNVADQLPDGSIITRSWEEAADYVAELRQEFTALAEQTTALSGDLQATDEAILDNIQAYDKSKAELAENFQIANERDDSKCVELCPGQDFAGGGFGLPQAPQPGVDAASGESRSEEDGEGERSRSILDNSVVKLGAAVTAGTAVVNQLTSGIDENSSQFAQAAGSIAQDGLQAATSIGSLNVAATGAVGALTGLKDVKVADIFERGAKDADTGKRAKTKIESRFDDIGKNLKSKFEGFGDILEKKGLPTFGKLSKKVSGLGNIIGKAGPIVSRFTIAAQTAAQVTGFLAKTIDNITGVNRKAEQAIKSGNVERARTTAIEAQRAKDINKVAQGIAVTGAAVGSAFGPLGTIVGAVAGALIGLGVKLASLTGVFDDALDFFRNSSIGAALGFSSTGEIGAQAAVKAAEQKTKNEQSRNDLVAGRARDRITAGESNVVAEFDAGNLTGNINNQLGERVQAIDSIQESRKRNQAAGSSAAGRGINAVKSLFGFETLTEEADRLAAESAKANADIVNDFRSNIGVYQDVAGALANTGASAAEIEKKLLAQLNPAIEKLGDPAAKELRDELAKVADRAAKAAKAQREYIQSLNFGLAGVNNNIGAVVNSFSLLDQAATSGVTKFEIAAAKLETALSTAAGGLSPDEIEQTVDTLKESIISAGGTEKQAAKVEDQFRGFQQVFSKLDENSGGFAQLKQGLAGLNFSGGAGDKNLLAGIGEVLTEGINDEDVKTRINAALKSGQLNDDDLKLLSAGNLSPLEKILGPTFEKFAQDVGGINAKVNEAQRSLISSIEARKAAEDGLVEAQRKTIDLQIEAAGLLDTLRPKALGAPSAEVLKARNEGFARERFNVGARVSGGRALTTGSTSDIRGSLQFLRNRQVNSRTETNRLALGGKATASVERSEADQNERDAAQSEELLAFTRTRIQEEQKLIETIKQRNAAEKSALESLLAGDIEAFIQQQEAAGAAAALETGSTSLAGLFDAGALGAGALALQERGALTSDAANLALGAFGVNNPQAGQVLAEQTPEIQAAQREIESLAKLLPEFGRALEDIKRTEIKAEQAIINAKQVKLDNARRDAEANPAGVAETLATTVGAAKEVVEGAKALDNGLSITSKAVGDSASLLGEAVQNLANTSLDVNINGDFVKGLINPQDIVSALTSQIGPVIAKQIAEGLKGIKIGNDGQAGSSVSPLAIPKK